MYRGFYDFCVIDVEITLKFVTEEDTEIVAEPSELIILDEAD